jgi:hypothetical protein
VALGDPSAGYPEPQHASAPRPTLRFKAGHSRRGGGAASRACLQLSATALNQSGSTAPSRAPTRVGTPPRVIELRARSRPCRALPSSARLPSLRASGCCVRRASNTPRCHVPTTPDSTHHIGRQAPRSHPSPPAEGLCVAARGRWQKMRGVVGHTLGSIDVQPLGSIASRSNRS